MKVIQGENLLDERKVLRFQPLQRYCVVDLLLVSLLWIGPCWIIITGAGPGPAAVMVAVVCALVLAAMMVLAVPPGLDATNSARPACLNLFRDFLNIVWIAVFTILALLVSLGRLPPVHHNLPVFDTLLPAWSRPCDLLSLLT